jgi:hypothetical protein
MELLDLVGQDVVPDQAEGEQAPGARQTPTGDTTVKKQLFGQKWINLRHDIVQKNYLKNCINKSSLRKYEAL